MIIIDRCSQAHSFLSEYAEASCPAAAQRGRNIQSGERERGKSFHRVASRIEQQ